MDKVLELNGELRHVGCVSTEETEDATVVVEPLGPDAVCAFCGNGFDDDDEVPDVTPGEVVGDEKEEGDEEET